jgi:hypothetical protein
MSWSSPWAAVREAGATIASNAQYVLEEIGRLDIPGDLRSRVEAVWRELNVAADRIRGMAARGETKKMPHPLDEIEWIETGLGPLLRALDDLVRDLDQATGTALPFSRSS